MIFSKKLVSSFGAALCVAPIFLLLVPTAWAQQGNNQSQMLFEMQAMRQEIAELRDMVERQAHQLRQLQNASPQTGNSSSGYNPVTGDPNYQQPSASQNDYETVTAGVPTEIDAPLVYSDNATNSNFPTTSGAQEGLNTDQYPISIEDRPTSAQPSGQVANDNFPPVEERTITGTNTGQQVPVYDPETYNRQAPAVNRQAPAVNRQAPAVNRQAPVGNQQQAPAVNAQAPVINPGDIQPYQRDVPSRQPIPNNIPSVDAPPGGVVTIPQGEVANNSAVSNQPGNTNSAAEQTYYQQGFELLKQSKHDEAVTTFKKQISDHPKGDYADDAHYWIAESLYVNRDLDQSKLYFKAIIDNFEQSPRLPDAMLKTAYIEQEQGNLIEARILLQEIIQFHPRSNAAISAKNRLADLN